LLPGDTNASRAQEQSATLLDFRRAAAEASGGTSGEPVKSLVLRLVNSEKLSGNLLDFGAGRGELLSLLQAQRRFTTLSGADVLSRPAWLPSSIEWIEQDLNAPLAAERQFDVVICSEVIEHLENPRHTFRSIHAALRPGGSLVLTMPNQESLRSYAALLFRGHFVSFVDSCYPAHITALLHTDLKRICRECGFEQPRFAYSNHGLVPKLPATTWQQVSLGLLAGRCFSDNLALIAKKIGATSLLLPGPQT
jgi:2-polyprenyl-3-methyl-5-hydroxy-6-metoxy-1,4-benzoquinol methylase